MPTDWFTSYRADPKARAVADRHYNRQKVGSPQFVPPGGCLVLATSRSYRRASQTRNINAS